MSEKAILHPAFVWDCERCGRENFERAVRQELSPQEEHELRAEHGVDPLEEGEFLGAPTEVTCAFCSEDFEVVDDRSPEESP